MFEPHPRAAFIGLALLVSLLGCHTETQVAPERSRFESEPPGATLYVEGGLIGETPCEFILPPKPFVDVRVVKPGYWPDEERLQRADVSPSAPAGVGWERIYYYPLKPKDPRKPGLKG